MGTNDTGDAPLGNSGADVRIYSVIGNTVGGTAPGIGNVIAFNSGAGVQVGTRDQEMPSSAMRSSPTAALVLT